MAAVSVEVAGLWPLSLGVVAFLTLLIIFSIFFVALCIDCHRRSFELKDPEADKKNPQSLIRVVKLEETMVRDNPMIGEIQNDEKEFNSNGEEPVAFTPWRSHLGAAQNNKDQTNGSAAAMEAESNFPQGNSVEEMLWRSHLRASQKQDTDHIYHTKGGGRSHGEGASSIDPAAATAAAAVVDSHRDRQIYAQVSRKVKHTAPPVITPEAVQAEEEEPSPPLPDRRAECEG